MKTTFKISVHTGPLSATNFAHLVECLRDHTPAKNYLCGTERLYFEVEVEGDAIDAHIAASDMLRKTFGSACNLRPLVGNALYA